MKRNLQIACGVVGLVLVIEISSYALSNPPSFLKGFIHEISASVGSSNSPQLFCVSTNPALDSSPTPTTPPASTGSVDVSDIASGCASPTSGNKPTFYVDATNGSDAGDGSQAHPWKSLQTVLKNDTATALYKTPYYNSDKSVANGATTVPTNPNGPVVAGDIIYLMNGSYGDVTVSGVNSDFITIEAAPGQTPVLSSLTVEGASKWIFEGLEIQSLRNSYNALATISSHSFLGPVSDIIFTNNQLSSQDDVSSWTQSDWLANAAYTAIAMTDHGLPGSSCLTVTNNAIKNVGYGVTVGVNNTLFSGNTIDNFGDDGLDYDASNIVISNNKITNNNSLGDGNHEDAMQGQIGNYPSYSNVTITGNTIIRQTSANLAFPTYLQGIDAFDSDWSNLTVTNNLVITNAYHGISFASVHGGTIAHNTVLNDGSACYTISGTPCSDKTSSETWIDVNSTTHEGSPTTNLTVENNISSGLQINALTGVTVSNNIAGPTVLSLPVAGKLVYYKTAGTYGDGNVFDPNLNSYFSGFNPTSYQFNVQPSGPAAGLGASL